MRSALSSSRLIVSLSFLVVIAYSLLHFTDFGSFAFGVIAFGWLASVIVLVLLLLSQAWKMMKQRSIRKVWLLFVGVLALCIVFFQPVETVIEKMKSPVIYYAENDGFLIGNSIKLRKDSSFEFVQGGLGNDDHYFGRYSLARDTLSLFFQRDTPEGFSSRFIMQENSFREILKDTLRDGEVFWFSENYN